MTSKRSLILIFLLFLPHTVFAATRYVVKKGDNLYGFSKKFNVAVNDLEKANRLDGNNLNVGDVVLVPTSTSANNKAASVSQGEYVVSTGDTLSEIGQKLGVSADSIESANNLNSKTLRIGQKLVIPSSSKSGYIDVRKETNTITHEKKPEEPGSKLSSASIQYTVRKGDTLGVIANNFGISLSELKRANGLRSDSLKVGKVLIIPGSVGEEVVRQDSSQQPVLNNQKYTVKKGDSLYGVSEKFGVSVDSIKKANGISNDTLKVGDTLLIPGSRELTLPDNTQEEKPQGTQNNLSSVSIEYTVRKGDTLGVIAKNFGLSLSELKIANGLRSDSLKVGRVLIIPGAVNKEVVRETSPKPVVISGRYVVKKGDSLHGLSKRFGISVASIKEASGIKGSNIWIGQVLTLPGKEQYIDSYNVDLPESDSFFDNNDYTMSQAGDPLSRSTIIKVAKKFLGAPYKFGGTSTVMGIDCSAFVNKVFDFFNVDLPRTARDIYKVGRSVAKSELATGDLVFFRTYASYPSHVGIYIENDEFIHASSAARKVTIDSINRSYYRKRYIGAKRIEVSGLFYGDLSEGYKGFEIQ